MNVSGCVEPTYINISRNITSAAEILRLLGVLTEVVEQPD